MPNHVTNRLRVTGPAPEVERFIAKMIVTSGETDWTGQPSLSTTFNFNALVPMPEALRSTEASSRVDDGIAVMEFDARQKGETFVTPPMLFTLGRKIEDRMEYPWAKEAGITSAQELRDRLVDRNPDCIEAAKNALAAYEQYGHMDWYSWACDNWGTKWNAYNFEEHSRQPGFMEFQFDTAWAPPEPVYAVMAKEFPSLMIDIVAFDEGWGFAYDASLSDGRVFGGLVDADDELYELVYGYAPEKETEDAA